MTKVRVLIIAGISVVLVAAIVVAVMLAGDGSKPDAAAGDTVRIELRSMPVAKIRMNGKAIGDTPKTLHVRRGTQPIELEATFTIEKIGLMRAKKKIETWRLIKQVVPDSEQTIDFVQKDAIKIDEQLSADRR